MKIKLTDEILDNIVNTLVDFCIKYNFSINSIGALNVLRNTVLEIEEFERLKKTISRKYPFETRIEDILENQIIRSYAILIYKNV